MEKPSWFVLVDAPVEESPYVKIEESNKGVNVQDIKDVRASSFTHTLTQPSDRFKTHFGRFY